GDERLGEIALIPELEPGGLDRGRVLAEQGVHLESGVELVGRDRFLEGDAGRVEDEFVVEAIVQPAHDGAARWFAGIEIRRRHISRELHRRAARIGGLSRRDPCGRQGDRGGDDPSPRPHREPPVRLSSARLSSSTFTRGSPKNPSCRPSMWRSTRARTATLSACRARATRPTCSNALAGEMWGSRPDPEDVTRSDGTRPFPAPSSFTALSTAGAISVSASFKSVGPLLVPPESVSSYPAPA